MIMDNSPLWRRLGLLAVALLAFGTTAAPPGDFNAGAPTEEVIGSLGVFRIAVHPDFDPFVSGLPGYTPPDPIANGDPYSRLTGPVLADSQTTIGRSVEHNHGTLPSNVDVAAGDQVDFADFTLIPPAFSVAANSTHEIYTLIKAFNLKVTDESCSGANSGYGVPQWMQALVGTVIVRAGSRPANHPVPGIGVKSPGQVQSTTGDPLDDFNTTHPARSFFDIFVEVDLYDNGANYILTLHNTAPMLVENSDVTQLPPIVVYIHGGTTAVPIYVLDAGTSGAPVGALFGWLTLAGHGVQFSCDPGAAPFSVAEFLDKVFLEDDGVTPRKELAVPEPCLLGTEWTTSTRLYDLDPVTGLALNLRNTGLDRLIGLEVTSSSKVLTITSQDAAVSPNTLFKLDRATGAPTPIAPIVQGAPLGDGDMTICPPAGLDPQWIYYSSRENLYKMKEDGTLQTYIGSVPPGPERSLSGLAFHSSGRLFAIDTAGTPEYVFELDPATAQILGQEHAIVGQNGANENLGDVVGFDFDPVTSVFYVVGGGAGGGSSRLYLINVMTGVVTPRPNPTGSAFGFSGLAVAPCECPPDLWMMDTTNPDLPEDVGAEPNTLSPAFYLSQDIWVRNSQDTALGGASNPGPNNTTGGPGEYYLKEHEHLNPIASTLNYVYVKVRNRGCTKNTGKEMLRVYSADASSGLPGQVANNPLFWTPIGAVSLPPIAPYDVEDYVVELPWIAPNATAPNDHFCLVARIETDSVPPYGMTYPEGPVLWENVKNNNNIVQKNVTIVPGGGGGGSLIVRNVLAVAAPLTLSFGVPPSELRNPFLLHGDVVVDLKALMDKWVAGGFPAVGFEPVPGTTQIRIVDTNAVVRGLTFAAGEEQAIEVHMQLKAGDASPAGTRYSYDVVELAPLTPNAEPSPIGGVRFSLVVPDDRVHISKTAKGVEITWFGGQLHQADRVTGPYNVVPGATSPHEVIPSGKAKFYRVVR